MKDFFKYIFVRLTCYSATCFFKLTIIENNAILILAPHPDDEIIGLGGLIIQTLKSGGRVNIVFLTDGEGSGAHSNVEEIKRQRLFLTKGVLKKLGMSEEDIFHLHLADGRIPRKQEIGFAETVEKLKEIVGIVGSNAIFATHPLDYWPYDHVACSELAVELKKNLNYRCDLWFYWVWSWYHLKPWQLMRLLKRKLVKLDIHGELDLKKELIDLYLKPNSTSGIPWSGNLPKSMIYPFTKPFEILEKYEG